MNQVFDEISKFFTIKKTDNLSMDYVSVDYNDMNTKVTPVTLDLKKFDNDNDAHLFITNELLQEVKKQAYLNRKNMPTKDDVTVFDFNLVEMTDSSLSKRENAVILLRKLMTKIMTVSNFIALEGRVGPGTAIIINPKWLKYNNISGNIFNTKYQSELYMTLVGKIVGMSIFVDSRVEEDEILVYRKNLPEQPTVIGIWNNINSTEVYYKTTSIGFFPEKQYAVIQIFI